jgi:hypothetical protein
VRLIFGLTWEISDKSQKQNRAADFSLPRGAEY